MTNIDERIGDAPLHATFDPERLDQTVAPEAAVY